MRLLLLRGAQGSGKSTYAKRVRAKLKGIFGVSAVICSADDFFLKTGTYRFDPRKLDRAHEECKKQAHQAFLHNIPYVLIDNTNVSRTHLQPYIRMAQEFGYEIVEKVLGLDLDATTLHARQVHGVPLAAIERAKQTLVESVRNVEGQTVKKVNGVLTVRIKR
jgi:predicted kinase